MNKELIISMKNTFDNIVHIDSEIGIEFWYARELQTVLGYTEWRNFTNVIDKAKEACKTTTHALSNHFVDVNKMVNIGSGTVREIDDIKLTRYACYLIAQNGDPRKDEIAFAQSYFALQTRKQEFIEDRINLLRRFEARQRLSSSESLLSKNIYERGVDDSGFGRIRSAGDAALFGKSTAAMKAQLAIKPNRPLADFLPTLTIAAKNLATEITNHNTEEKDLYGEEAITIEHISNNKAVRGMLADRGIKPEELPPAEDIKKLERRVKSEEKKLAKDTGFNR
ncbi:DNA damage-inducible protein D [uncultured Anaerovibrio sp.]|uniref:DNA damage-inducible protein D n=1 Tax=uncultured Anaerovibrio sp. TaxID=361586 RepID=UPI00260E0C8E|nr:DNA damage-inducible protein D [uncultured Anaerovibrio sp.]